MVAPDRGPLPPCGTADALLLPMPATAPSLLPDVEASPVAVPVARAAARLHPIEASGRRTAREIGHRPYLPFIDGLRAVSILGVIACHLDMQGFPGGYVGVDIFFVISGYLIINQIIADLANRRFSLLGFGARRACRILPAFLLVMVTCLVLVTTLFVQPEYTDFAQSFFFSAVMLVNHYYLAHQGYFDMAGFMKPLLHMWSLAVEEQFYLVTPVILLGLTAATAKIQPAHSRRIWVAATATLAVASFAACVALTRPPDREDTAFYAMYARGWEFIAGGLAASLARELRRRPSWLSESLGMAGICAIGLAMTLFNADTHYPSYRAMLPAVAAMSVIASGLAWPRIVVARALAIRPMVGIGLVSYAWYLWHWPLLSFVRTMSFGNLDAAEQVTVIGVSLLLAVLTYRLIEVPVRSWGRAGRVRPGVVAMVAPACCLSVACVGYAWSVGVAPHMLPTIAGLDFRPTAASEYPAAVHPGMLFGDSHASMLRGMLEDRSRLAGSSLTVAAIPGCPPLLHTGVINYRAERWAHCSGFQEMSFAGFEFLIMAARWNYYLGLPPSDPFFRSFVLVDERGISSPASPYAQLAKGLAATISAAKGAGVRRVLIVAPFPEFPMYAPYCLLRTIRVGIDRCKIERSAIEARRARTMATLREVTAGIDGVRLIDPIGLFCTEATCQPHQGRTVYFADSNHLSAAGAERFYKAYESDFVWALTGEDARKAANKTVASLTQE